jgi:benzylsuccinate CoA-transferase BbsF subunit
MLGRPSLKPIDADSITDAEAARPDAHQPVGEVVALRIREFVMGPSIYDGIPYRLSATPGRLRSPAPLLGAHTREVCTELLGLSGDDYAALANEGIVG